MSERHGRRIADAGRIIAVVALLLASVTLFTWWPWFSPLSAVGLVPLGSAVWLVVKAPWSRRARVAAFVGAVAVTYVLIMLLIIIAFSHWPASD